MTLDRPISATEFESSAETPEPIRVLIVEDNPGDAKLLVLALQRDGFAPDWRRVETESEFVSAVASGADVILADCVLPFFDGLRALEIARGLNTHIPFLLVSGAMADEIAVEAIKRGADDYLLKDRLARLGEAVRRAIEQQRLRKENLAAAEALRESEERYRLISQITSDYAYSIRVDVQGGLQCEWASEPFTRITGFTVDEINARGWMTLYHPDDRSVVDQHKQRVLANRAEPVEVRVVTKTGEIRWVRCYARPVWDQAEGRVVRLLAAAQDITSRKELERQLIQAQKMEAVGRLAAGIAHDFNNILTLITGYTGLLLARIPPDNPLRREISELCVAAQRASGLTKRLLMVGSRQVEQTSIISLNALITELDPLLQRVVGEDVRLSKDFAPNVGGISADQVHIEQILMNLVINARDALSSGGVVTIATANTHLDNFAAVQRGVPPGEYVVLTVSDNGHGMDAGTMARIFEPFFTTKEVGKGTGLGLWTVREIVQNSRGAVTVCSEPGRGTSFKILFPRSLQPCVPVRKFEQVIAKTTGTETILIVEDDEDLRELMREILKPAGYRILVANEGSQALRITDEHDGAIHLLVTDVAMPAMRGTDLASRMAAKRADIRVLYISGYSAQQIIREDPSMAGRAYLQKPFTGDALLQSIREVLDVPVEATILVADDDPGIRKLLEGVLHSSGYRVLEASDGRQAVEHLGNNQVDLLITDLLMPDQEGIETIRAVRKRFPGLKIIAMSGGFGEQFLNIAKLMGADRMIRKPFETQAIREAIRHLLARPS